MKRRNMGWILRGMAAVLLAAILAFGVPGEAAYAAVGTAAAVTKQSLFDLKPVTKDGVSVHKNVTTNMCDMHMDEALLPYLQEYKNPYILYDLGRQYSTLTGVAGISAKGASSTAGKGGLEFIAVDSSGAEYTLPMAINDSKVVYTLFLGSLDDPVDVKVDVTGVRLLKIRVFGGGYDGLYIDTINDMAFGNAVLTKARSASSGRTVMAHPLFDLKPKAKQDMAFKTGIRTSAGNTVLGRTIITYGTEKDEPYMIFDLGKKYAMLAGIAGMRDKGLSTNYGKGEIAFYATDGNGNDTLLPVLINWEKTAASVELGCYDEPVNIAVDVTGVRLLKIVSVSGGMNMSLDNLNAPVLGELLLAMTEPKTLE